MIINLHFYAPVSNIWRCFSVKAQLGCAFVIGSLVLFQHFRSYFPLLQLTEMSFPPFLLILSPCGLSEMSSAFNLDFEVSGIHGYVMMDGVMPALTEITCTFWMRSSDTTNYGTPVSYAVEGSDNAFLLIDYNGSVMQQDLEDSRFQVTGSFSLYFTVFLLSRLPPDGCCM